MVDLATIVAAYAGLIKHGTQADAAVGQLGNIVGLNLQAMIADQEEPVAAPGDIPVHAAVARHLDGYLGGAAVAGDIAQADPVAALQGGFNHAYRGFDTVGALAYAARWARVTTRPMVPWPHMPMVPTLLKKMTPATQLGSRGFAQQGADHRVAAAWFIEYGGAVVIEFAAETGAPFGQGVPWPGVGRR